MLANIKTIDRWIDAMLSGLAGYNRSAHGSRSAESMLGVGFQRYALPMSVRA